MLTAYLPQALWIVLLVSGIPLAVSCLAGLAISVLQAATQIQEQSIQYVVRFLAVSGVLIVCGGWFWHEVVIFLQRMLASFAQLGHMP